MSLTCDIPLKPSSHIDSLIEKRDDIKKRECPLACRLYKLKLFQVEFVMNGDLGERAEAMNF